MDTLEALESISFARNLLWETSKPVWRKLEGERWKNNNNTHGKADEFEAEYLTDKQTTQVEFSVKRYSACQVDK